MYNYTVILDKSFEPSNQEQRTQVAEYIAIYETKDNYGWNITALDLSGVTSAWNARYNRISIQYMKIISIVEKVSGKIIYQDKQ